ncbi:hypothetical protein [Sphingomonas sp. Ant20]|jgi:hypothetical protein|nr:hypothetical protein [Sphingomonas sp. Ant20]
MLGIIDAGTELPGVFLTAESRAAAGIELAPADNDVDAFFFTSSGTIG